MKKIYNYNNDTKTAIFKICDKGKVFIGKAKPAPEDFDIANELTGLTIAEYKAKIAREEYKLKYWDKKELEYKKLMEESNNNYKTHIKRHDELKHKLDSYKKQKENFKRRFEAIKKREEVFYK